MGSSHQHGAGHGHSVSGNRKRLVIVILIVAVVFIAEVVGGILTGSLALLADAGHMLSDLIGLTIALIASIVAAKPATDRQTYGYRRAEVFGALANGTLLLVVCGFIVMEAVARLTGAEAAEISSVPMLIVAVVGLVANVAGLLILRSGAKDSINMRGAYLEVLGDTLGSLAVIVAGVVMLATGFMQADAIASLVIAAMILPRAILLLKDVFSVLSESVPSGMSVEQIREHLLAADGVEAVHDVHVWSITSGEPVFTAHIVVEEEVFRMNRTDALLDTLSECLSGHFDVAHSTFQLEPGGHETHEQFRH